ncbi:MAG: hypothetical protein L3J04_11650 [Robiginitomaculum sp.]|nr:hypothetical protein [Robiginitomaculum sp.]
MRLLAIIFIGLSWALLMGNSASFAETGNNNKIDEKLLIGSWYMPEPFVHSEEGVTISLTDVKVSFLKDNTSTGSTSMHFVAGNGVAAMRQNGISLTYHIKAITNWSYDAGVITDTLTQITITAEQPNAISQGVAVSLAAAMRSEPPSKYKVILLSKTDLQIKDIKTGIIMEYKRAVD